MKIESSNTNTKKGFTIIETLVSFTIFSFALVGLLAMTGKGISDVTIAKNRMVANFLAQEGVELIRAMRDDQIVAANSAVEIDQAWGVFTNLVDAPCSAVNQGCDIDPLGTGSLGTLSPHPCNDGQLGCALFFNTKTGYYGYKPDADSASNVFNRSIVVERKANSNERLVTVTVSWKKGLRTENTQVTENLYSWN